jgi:aspartate racemase
LKKIGLLGTKFTMEEDFYKRRLTEKYGFDVIIPTEGERRIIHDVIFNELCLGEIKQSSKEQFKKIIENLVARGAEGIILGCTEIPLLVKQEDFEVSLFDTMMIHAKSAVEYAIKK